MAGQLRAYRLHILLLAVLAMLNGSVISSLPFRALALPQTPSLAVITPENVDQIQLLRFLGRGIITDMAWSPDGNILALGSIPSGVIWLYNPDDLNAQPRWLIGNPGGVTQLAFSGDGKMLVSAGLDNAIHIWDMEALTEYAQYPRSNVSALALSWDGKFVAVAGGRTISVIDSTGGEEILVLKGHEKKINAVTFSPDAKLLISAAFDATVRVWDVESGTQLAKLDNHNETVTSIAFNPDGGMFASGNEDGTVRLWDWNDAAGTIGLVRRGHTKVVDRLIFSPDGRMLASSSQDNTIRLWNMDTTGQQAVLIGHTDHIRGIAFSPDGKTLASVSDDQTLRLWDPTTGVQLNSVELVRGHLSRGGAVFSPDGATVASMGDGTLQLWDANTGEHRQTIETDASAGCPGYSADGKKLVTGGFSGNVAIWDLETLTNRVMGENIITGICVAYSPDGKTIAASSDGGTARLWDIATGDERILNHQGSVAGVVYSPDSKTLASGGTDDGVRLWEVATGKELALLSGASGEGMSFPMFSADGKLLAAGGSTGNYDLYIWDVATLTVQAVLPSHQFWPYVSFTSDNRILMSSDGPDDELNVEGSVRLWDIEKGVQLRILSTYPAPASAWFNAQGTMIVIAAENGVVELWGIPISD